MQQSDRREGLGAVWEHAAGEGVDEHRFVEPETFVGDVALRKGGQVLLGAGCVHDADLPVTPACEALTDHGQALLELVERSEGASQVPAGRLGHVLYGAPAFRSQQQRPDGGGVIGGFTLGLLVGDEQLPDGHPEGFGERRERRQADLALVAALLAPPDRLGARRGDDAGEGLVAEAESEATLSQPLHVHGVHPHRPLPAPVDDRLAVGVT